MGEIGSKGRLLGIAAREKAKAPMQELGRAQVTAAQGVAFDSRGKTPGRSVTVLTREGWESACRELGTEAPWTTRRANLLVEGVELAETTGRRLRIGEVVLEITGECDPCALMEKFIPGLRKALEPDWRAGVMAIVVGEGEIAPGDTVELEADAP